MLCYLCMQIYINKKLSISLIDYVYIYIFLPTFVPTYLSIYLSSYLSMYLSIYLSIYPSISLSIYPYIYIYECAWRTKPLSTFSGPSNTQTLRGLQRLHLYSKQGTKWLKHIWRSIVVLPTLKR